MFRGLGFRVQGLGFRVWGVGIYWDVECMYIYIYIYIGLSRLSTV